MSTWQLSKSYNLENNNLLLLLEPQQITLLEGYVTNWCKTIETPTSDEHITLPHNIHLLSNKHVMRIFKLIRKKCYFDLTSKTYKTRQGNVWQVEGKINNQILGVKGLNHHHYYQCVVIIVGYNKSIAILFALTFLWGTFTLPRKVTTCNIWSLLTMSPLNQTLRSWE